MRAILLGQRRKNIVFFMICSVLAVLLNASAAFSPHLGIVIGLISILVLLVAFFRRSIEDFILLYIFITTTALEGQVFYTGNSGIPLYNFLNLPIVHGYHVYLFVLMPWFLMLIPVHDSWIGNWKKYNNLSWYLKGISFLGMIGVIMTLLCILANVNDILDSDIFILYVRRDILKMGWGVSLSLLLAEMLAKHDGFAAKLEDMLYAMLMSILPSSLIFILLGETVIFGRVQVLPIGLFFFFSGLLSIFILYPQYKKNFLCLVSGIGICAVTLIYPSVLGGKWWLVIFSIPIIVLFLFKKQCSKRKVILTILGVFVVVLGIQLASWYLSHANELSIHKLNSAKAIMEIWKPGWLENMPNSPKHRIDEFLNILIELKEHPLFLPFGKGYGGNILHHISLKPWTIDGDFSVAEVSEGLFFNLHETVNWMFLKSGVLGLGFTIAVTFKCIKNIKYTPWIVLGFIWFLFYYSNYISMSFGLACLILGLYQVDRITGISLEEKV